MKQNLMAAAIPKVSKLVDIIGIIWSSSSYHRCPFKLEHWKFADTMLIVGLGTEAFIFAFMESFMLITLHWPDHPMEVKIAGETKWVIPLKINGKNAAGSRILHLLIFRN